MSANRFWVLMGRGLRQRCPVCGKGKVFAGLFKTYERCPNCNFYFEREEGYYTGAVAINLIEELGRFDRRPSRTRQQRP